MFSSLRHRWQWPILAILAPVSEKVVYRKSEVGKFCEVVVNRKDSRTTKFTIYDLFWNGGQDRQNWPLSPMSEGGEHEI
jgi:hypothetical protein